MSSANAILSDIERAHADWTNSLNELTEEQLTARGQSGSGDWSVKDIVAHVGVYEWWLAEFITARHWPALPPHLDSPDTDTRNEAFYLEYRDTPLADVLARANRAHHSLVTAIATMSDEDFADGTRLGFPEGPGWDPRRLILASTIEHYAAHAGAIRRVLDQGEP